MQGDENLVGVGGDNAVAPQRAMRAEDSGNDRVIGAQGDDQGGSARKIQESSKWQASG